MTLNHDNADQSRFDSSERTPAKDRNLANQDPGVNRREFLGMTAASLLAAGSLSGAAEPHSKNGIPSDSAGITWANRAIRRRAFASFALGSMKESTFSITAGTTTTERAKFAWAERYTMVTGRRPF